MTRKIVILVLVLAILMSLMGCFNSSEETKVQEVSKFGYDVVISPYEYKLKDLRDGVIMCEVPEEFEVFLVHNSGTSQEWHYHIDGDAVEFLFMESKIPEGQELMVGGEVYYYYYFRCKHPGEVTITFTKGDSVRGNTWDIISFTVLVN